MRLGMQPDRTERCIHENVHVVDVFVNSFDFLMKEVGLACVLWMFLIKKVGLTCVL
jgi:hypothetical protein